MASLVTLGKIARPHGYRGELVAVGDAGHESALAYLKTLFIGAEAPSAQPFQVIESTWMPRGWKLKLEGLSSDAEVKALQGALVFAKREDLSEPEENEFYLADLLDTQVIERDTGTIVGRFKSVETSQVPEGRDRWWIQTEQDLLAIPATRHFIDETDLTRGIVYVKNLAELR